MLTRFISVVSPLFLTAVSAAPAATCNEVQIFIAVGHGETYPGTQRSIAQLVCAKHSSCGTANIDYPSTASGAYCASVETGIKNGIAAITSYASSCPSAKIVLTGWSQGAGVVGDIIAGGGGVGQGSVAKCTQKTNPPLDPNTEPGKHIVAVTLFGDPRHTAGASFNVGTANEKNGAWPRLGEQLDAEKLWADRLRSYCADGDIACANGTSTQAHGSYFGSATAKAPADFIISKLG